MIQNVKKKCGEDLVTYWLTCGRAQFSVWSPCINAGFFVCNLGVALVWLPGAVVDVRIAMWGSVGVMVMGSCNHYGILSNHSFNCN